jgi:hypothetical protein
VCRHRLSRRPRGSSGAVRRCCSPLSAATAVDRMARGTATPRRHGGWRSSHRRWQPPPSDGSKAHGAGVTLRVLIPRSPTRAGGDWLLCITTAPTRPAAGRSASGAWCAATSSRPTNAGQGMRRRAPARRSEPAGSMSRPRCNHSDQLRAQCPPVTGDTTREPPHVSRTPPGILLQAGQRHDPGHQLRPGRTVGHTGPHPPSCCMPGVVAPSRRRPPSVPTGGLPCGLLPVPSAR